MKEQTRRGWVEENWKLEDHEWGIKHEKEEYIEWIRSPLIYKTKKYSWLIPCEITIKEIEEG